MTSAFPLAVVLKGIDQLSGPLGKAEARLGRFGNKASQIGRKLTTAVALPTLALGAAAVTVGANFEAEMLTVQALSGETGEALESLRSKAKELGATTQFSASESAAGMSELALAGQDAGEILASIPPILNLAAGSNTELARASEIAIGVLKGQRFEADQMRRVTDTLTGAFTSSANTLEDLSFAFTDAGPVAAGLGIEFEETAAALAIMGDNMFKGQKGGVALRGALKAIVAPTGAAVATFNKLDIKHSDLFDAEGRLISLANTVSVLKRQGAGVPDLFQLFGRHAGAMSTLVAQAEGTLEDLTMKLGEGQQGIGRTAEVAAVKMQGAAGAMKSLRSATEALGISVADSGLLEWFTNTTNALAGYTRELAAADAGTLRTVTLVGGAAIGFTGFLLVLGAAAKAAAFLATGWGVLTGATVALTTAAWGGVTAFGAMAAAFFATPIGWLVAGLASIAAGAYLVWDQWEAIKEGAIATGNAIRTGIGAAFDWLGDKVAAVVDIMPDWLIDAVGAVNRAGGRAFEFISTGFGSSGPSGQPIGATSDRLEAERRTAAQSAGGESRILVDFANVERGTRITQDGDDIPIDLALGVSLS